MFYHNPDEKRRKAERLASTGDPQKQAEALNERLRAGELDRWRLATLAHLNYPPAQKLLGTDYKLMPFRNWWNRITYLVPDANATLRFELRFRGAFAAVNALLVTISVYPIAFSTYLKKILRLLEEVFLEGIYAEKGYTSFAHDDLEEYYSIFRESLINHTIGILPPPDSTHGKNPELATMMLFLLEGIRSFFLETPLMIPHQSPGSACYEAAQRAHRFYPVGMGGLEQKISEELIPVILMNNDPIFYRSKPASWR